MKNAPNPMPTTRKPGQFITINKTVYRLGFNKEFNCEHCLFNELNCTLYDEVPYRTVRKIRREICHKDLYFKSLVAFIR